MNKSFLKLGFPFIVLSVLALMSIPCAQAEFVIKPFKGSLSISERAYYNSNPGYADKGNHDPSWASLLTLRAALELPFGELHKYSFNSTTAWKKYFDSDADSWDAVSSSLSHSLDLVFNKWSLNIHHKFDDTEEPEGAELGALERNKFKKRVNYPGFVVKGDLGKMKLAVGGDFQQYRTNDRYEDLEKDIYSAFIETGLIFTPLLDGFVRYTYTDVERLDSRFNDSQGHDVRLGLRGELTPYLVGEVAAGYAAVYFEDANPTMSGFYSWGDSTDYEGVVFSGSLTNRLSDLTTQKLTFSLEPVPSYNVGNYHETYSVQYNINHQLNSKLNLNGSVLYLNSQESGGSPRFREDSDIWQAGSGFVYALGKNLDLVGDYQYTQKESDVQAKDYIQHEASMGVRYTF